MVRVFKFSRQDQCTLYLFHDFWKSVWHRMYFRASIARVYLTICSRTLVRENLPHEEIGMDARQKPKYMQHATIEHGSR